jgi:hypothetical protein
LELGVFAEYATRKLVAPKVSVFTDFLVGSFSGATWAAANWDGRGVLPSELTDYPPPALLTAS